MSPDPVTRIIRDAYGKKYKLDSHALAPRAIYFPSVREYLSLLTPVADFFRSRSIYIAALLLSIITAVMTIYYYNILVESEQMVLTAQGKVSVLMQRRNDISINLSKAVLDYSTHEREVLTAIVALRTMLSGEKNEGNFFQKEDGSAKLLPKSPVTKSLPGKAATEKLPLFSNPQQVPGSLPELGLPAAFTQGKAMAALAPDTMESLGRLLLAVAEQYPDLKLSANFSSLMAALVEVEKDLATERLKFNDAVNAYTTNIAKFPSNLYAAMFNFPPQSYFEPTNDAKQLVPISY
ncbi:Putative LemA family protein (modular protein), magnetosome protein MamQ. Homology with gene DMR_41130 of RS-1 [Desulfamplus magnetovallimortis]|uniref:Magnetosome protein n=2 Tax=Desulfamplus magnetovallimortis TaxID=1246637 RepID=G8IQU3_9BACT|nr:LemA family protein [Desulfamplus magnetovallimortis]AET24916.1 magnetosome protein [Desulfamplus magnetovallimortis BW-1]CCO06673.1 Putative LemA family protein (modular protein),magnetosome protein MamQ. Homology with gene DMR_41130 of RS-1 [Desulfamplus magnetovallimortis BW-1]SLM32724.1 Putative LemA family protein (modular protein), magnetosome protein MamQ. Homology with gene DMR_41130 of RS-1 [Desulfamplus magnetovallimortis]